jgi:hypothetical protein
VGDASTPVSILSTLGRGIAKVPRKVDIRIPEKGNSNSHGARPVFYNSLDNSVDLDQ